MLSAAQTTVPSRSGFTLVEVTVALVIFMVGILGLGSTGVTLLRTATEIEVRELAVQAMDDRLTAVSIDPRYTALDSLYAGTETGVFDRFSRTTVVTHTRTAVSGGGVLDFKTVGVVVRGGGLDEPMSRMIRVAAP